MCVCTKRGVAPEVPWVTLPPPPPRPTPRLCWACVQRRQQLGPDLVPSIPPSGLPDLQRVVLIPYVLPREKIDISKIPNR